MAMGNMQLYRLLHLINNQVNTVKWHFPPSDIYKHCTDDKQ